MTDLQTLLTLYSKIGVQCVINELGDGVQSVGIAAGLGDIDRDLESDWTQSNTYVQIGYEKCEKIAYHKNIIGYNDFYCVHFFRDGQLIKVGIWE